MQEMYICKCTHRDKPEFQVRNGSKCDSYKSLSFLARSLTLLINTSDGIFRCVFFFVSLIFIFFLSVCTKMAGSK